MPDGGRCALETSRVELARTRRRGLQLRPGAYARCRRPTPASAWTTRRAPASSSRSSRPSRPARAPGWGCPRCTASCSRAAAAIDVESAVDDGHDVPRLPPAVATGQEVASRRTRPPRRAAARAGARCFVAEDEEAVRVLVRTVLAGGRLPCARGRVGQRSGRAMLDSLEHPSISSSRTWSCPAWSAGPRARLARSVFRRRACSTSPGTRPTRRCRPGSSQMTTRCCRNHSCPEQLLARVHERLGLAT